MGIPRPIWLGLSVGLLTICWESEMGDQRKRKNRPRTRDRGPREAERKAFWREVNDTLLTVEASHPERGLDYSDISKLAQEAGPND